MLVLESAGRKFLDNMAELSEGKNVFSTASTLSSFVHKYHRFYWKFVFGKPNLPILQKHVPQTGYARRSSRFFSVVFYKNKFSILEEGFLGIKHSISQIGKMYLDFLEHKYKVIIRREVKIESGITVDGLIERLETEGIPLFAGIPLLTRIVLEIEGIFLEFLKILIFLNFMLPVSRMFAMLVDRNYQSNYKTNKWSNGGEQCRSNKENPDCGIFSHPHSYL